MKKYVIIFPNGKKQTIEAEYYHVKDGKIHFYRKNDNTTDELHIPDTFLVYPEDFVWETRGPLQTSKLSGF